MRKFVVENRRSGSIVLHGVIEGADGLKVLESSLSQIDQDRVIAEIKADIAEGNSGGDLRMPGLVWAELFHA